jgi:hypothetical protein
MIRRRNHERYPRNYFRFHHHCRRVRGSVRAAVAHGLNPPGLGGPVGSGPGQPSLGPGSGLVRSGRSGLEGGLQGLKRPPENSSPNWLSIPVETLNH